MPDSFVQLPPDSTGKRVRSWQDPASGEHEYFVRIGRGRGGVLYAASSDLIVWTATASLRVWGIFNPGASGKTLYLRRLDIIQQASAAGVVVAARLHRTTDTTTTGAAITAVRPDGGTVGNVAVVRALPTAGTITGGSFATTNTPSVAGGILADVMWDAGEFMNRDIVVPQGTGLLLQVSGTPDADMRSTVECTWEEA